MSCSRGGWLLRGELGAVGSSRGTHAVGGRPSAQCLARAACRLLGTSVLELTSRFLSRPQLAGITESMQVGPDAAIHA